MTDGFGRRVLTTDAATGEPIEQLELAPNLVSHPGFVTALAERVTWLADIRHASYVHVRRLDRPAADRLVVVSDPTAGPRLADLLVMSGKTGVRPDIRAVVAVLRQLLPAAALFARGRQNRDRGIGNLAPERLFIMPPARVVIADIAFGTSLDQLGLDRVEAWRRFGIVSPVADGPVASSPRGDAMAIGVVALSMLLGRLLGDSEFPRSLPSLVSAARERHGDEERALSRVFAKWLLRALQLDSESPFDSPQAAQIAFEEVLASDTRYVTQASALEAWVAEYERHEGSKLAGSKPGASKHEGSKRAGSKYGGSRPGGSKNTAVEPGTSPAADSGGGVAVLDEPAPPARWGRPASLTTLFRNDPASAAAVEASADAGADRPALDDDPAAREQAPGLSRLAGWRDWLPKIAAGLLGVAVIEALVIAWLWTGPSGGPLEGEGELVVQSRPPAARVIIDGEDRGATPLTIKLAAGTHVLEVQAGSSPPRVIPLAIRAGVQTSQYVELQEPPQAPAASATRSGAVKSSGRR